MPHELLAPALVAVIAPIGAVIEGAKLSVPAAPRRVATLHDGVAPSRRRTPPHGQVGPAIGDVDVVGAWGVISKQGPNLSLLDDRGSGTRGASDQSPGGVPVSTFLVATFSVSPLRSFCVGRG